MKILFLDCDGVLNNRDSLNGDAPHFGDATTCWVVGIAQMELLKEIVDRTGCKIVLSSTWRLYDQGRIQLMRFFVKAGIDPTIVIGKTSLIGTERHKEIEKWLKEHPCDNFVIVDDDPDACIEGHFVQTKFKEGLTREKTDDILSLFGSEVTNLNAEGITGANDEV